MILDGYEFSSMTLMSVQKVRYHTLSCLTSGEQPRKTSVPPESCKIQGKARLVCYRGNSLIWHRLLPVLYCHVRAVVWTVEWRCCPARSPNVQAGSFLGSGIIRSMAVFTGDISSLGLTIMMLEYLPNTASECHRQDCAFTNANCAIS